MPLDEYAETQVLYLYAGADKGTQQHRYIRIERKLSMQKQFEVVDVQPVSERTREEPGIMVYEIVFPIEVSLYRTILKEKSEGSMATAQERYNIDFEQLMLPFEGATEGDHHE